MMLYAGMQRQLQLLLYSSRGLTYPPIVFWYERPEGVIVYEVDLSAYAGGGRYERSRGTRVQVSTRQAEAVELQFR